MKIIFSRTIKQKELWKNSKDESLKIIIDYYKRWISVDIKWNNLPKNSKLIKIYVTTVFWDKRIVYMVDMVSKDVFFLFYRSKKDKIWENISIRNTSFKENLNKYLDILFEDIKSDNIDIYDI